MSDEKPSVVTVTGLQMDDPLQPLRVLEYAKPTHRLQFYGDNNVLVATIHPDGRVEFGPGYTTDDDVSRRLWTCFGQLPAKLAEAEADVTRLQGLVAELRAERDEARAALADDARLAEWEKRGAVDSAVIARLREGWAEAEQLRGKVERLKVHNEAYQDLLSVVAAPLAINAEEHAAVVQLARRFIGGQKTAALVQTLRTVAERQRAACANQMRASVDSDSLAQYLAGETFATPLVTMPLETEEKKP